MHCVAGFFRNSKSKTAILAKKIHCTPICVAGDISVWAIGKVGTANLTKPNFKAVSWSTENVEKLVIFCLMPLSQHVGPMPLSYYVWPMPLG